MRTSSRNANLEWPIRLKTKETRKKHENWTKWKRNRPDLDKDIIQLKWYYSSGTMHTKQSKKTTLFCSNNPHNLTLNKQSTMQSYQSPTIDERAIETVQWTKVTNGIGGFITDGRLKFLQNFVMVENCQSFLKH